MVAVNLKSIVLKDNWPGSADPNLGIPTGGFDATTHTDASTEVYPIGTKIQAYQDFSGLSGPYIMIYLRYYCVSGHNAVETADMSSTTGQALFKQFCNSECLSADGTAAFFTCTNVGTINTGYTCGTNAGLIAIACGTLSDRDTTGTGGTSPGGYGWFWCGGVCPVKDITMYDNLAGHTGVDMSTAGGVAASQPINVEADTSVLVFDGGDLSSVHVGWSMETDA